MNDYGHQRSYCLLKASRHMPISEFTAEYNEGIHKSPYNLLDMRLHTDAFLLKFIQWL